MKKNNLLLVLLILIVVLGAVLRFFRLGEVPVALNRDEASLGYTAWSLLHTGRDEHGVYMPINIQSFGDWKLPVYVYTLIPVVAVFGLNEWSVRVVSAVSGVLLIITTYGIVSVLSRDFYKKPDIGIFRYLPYLSALFVAISPWSIHMSRIAYEANLALAIFSLGILCFLKVTIDEHLSWRARYLLLIGSALFFGLTVFTYHAYQVLTPLMTLFLVILYRAALVKIFRTKKYLSVLPIFIFVFFIVALLLSQTSGANQTKYGGISILSEKQYEQNLFVQRQLIASTGPWISKLYISMPKMLFDRLITNVMDLVNPNFLFKTGGSHGSHNFPGFGNMFWFGLLTLPIGLFSSLVIRKRPQVVVLGWLVLSMIAPVITTDAAHSIRFSPAILPLEIISAFGLLSLLAFFFRRNMFAYIVMSALASLVITYSVFVFVVTYFVLFPVTGINNWPWYMKEIVSIATDPAHANKRILMQGQGSSPYIWFLFYQPEKYSLNDLGFYPPSDEGFVHVRQLANITFGDIDWNDEASDGSSAMFFVRPSEIDGKNIGNTGTMEERSILNSSGKDVFLVLAK